MFGAKTPNVLPPQADYQSAYYPIVSAEERLQKIAEENFRRATDVRASAIQKFRRDYFLHCLDHDYSVDVLDRRATEMAERLYPAVTKENVRDYLNRSF